MQEFNKNHYGMALSYYSMGFVYKNYGEQLCINGSFKDVCEEDHLKYLVDSLVISHQKAI